MARIRARRSLKAPRRDENVLALAERMVAGKGAEAEYVDVEPEEREEIRSRVQSYLARFKKREEELKPSESKSKEGGEGK